MFGKRQNKTVFFNVSGIVCILFSAIICMYMSYISYLSIGLTALIMIAIVIIAAIGNVTIKLSICVVAIFLLAKCETISREGSFHGFLGSVLTLFIALVGLYFIRPRN